MPENRGSRLAFWRSPFMRAFLGSPSGGFAVALAIGLLAISIIVPRVFTDDEIYKRNIRARDQNPSSEFILGTDQLGRDILKRTLYATRLSLELSISAALIAVVIGLPFGAVVAYLPGRLRVFSLRFIEVLLAFPGILIAILVVAVLGGGSAVGAVLAIGISFSPSLARVAYTLASGVAGREYIASARVLGLSGKRIIARYLLPNIAETLIVVTFNTMGSALVAVSSLSFLGLGVQGTEFDWGRMLTDGVQKIYLTPFSALTPAIAIATTGLAFGYMGEALARAMNPLLWTQSKKREEAPTSPTAPISQEIATQKSRPLTGYTNGKEKKPLLKVRGLTVKFPTPRGSIYPVANLSFDIAEGEVIGIVGESGSGKSMTALALAQLVPYPGALTADALELRGDDLLKMPHYKQQAILGTDMAMVFQDPMSSLNPALRIGTQVIEASQVHRGLSKTEATALAVDRMNDVHIPIPEARMKQYPHEFSGGMRQRAMIAMGLMNKPSLIIADEPTTALDVTIQAQIIDVLREINREHGTAILLISHDIGVISEICSRVLVMYGGRIVEDISTTKLLTEPTHPYTQALMTAVPNIAADKTKPLASIPGRPPDLDSLPRGCAFAPRCPAAVERCQTERPPLEEVITNHQIACWVARERLLQLREGIKDEQA